MGNQPFQRLAIGLDPVRQRIADDVHGGQMHLVGMAGLRNPSGGQIIDIELL